MQHIVLQGILPFGIIEWNWTYPLIQPESLEYAERAGFCGTGIK